MSWTYFLGVQCCRIPDVAIIENQNLDNCQKLKDLFKKPKVTSREDRMGRPGPINISDGDLWMFWAQNDILTPLGKLPSTENRKHE